MLIKPFYVMVVAALLACAGSSPRAGPHHDFNLITEAELAETPGTTSAYEVVGKLRPNFFKSRGRSSINNQGSETAAVFVDGQFYGNINSLQNLTTTHIHEIRFLSIGDAVTRYGMQYGNGVIDVRMK
ncbi:MAG: hypothetical protein ABI469_07545 [Gemmatimonadales bacterium]